MSDSYIQATAHFETILDFLRLGYSEANKAGLFYGHGTDNAWDDIFWLVTASLSLPVSVDKQILAARLTQSEKTMLAKQLAKRIIERIPVAYLIHEAFFCDLPFYVDERVLIPRSPIGELINHQFSPWIDTDQVHRVLDLCTGSACIAIACGYAFPDASIDAVDLSSAALEVAEINRQNHGMEDQLQLIQSDCWEKVPAVQYDIIVSNPPYVGKEEMSGLPQEYRHEPEMALECADNGLAIVEKILANAHHYLTEHGILVVEVGNSEDALIKAYPDLDFVWLDFEQGGHGVFLLTAQQLKSYFGKQGQ
ncbi:N5-glutamine methyltransferase [Legionella birminghamensis]|uniref:N5-glutamine methyltransferase n=1 Tax=Legionella birminghamensis TaxID=28083 RepID=A0A378I8K1_9GAMM|nr:50S ribosomal protein L3 N(5)-glutamine methyltransferase [Legionella birminghamensis]KTC68326.1 N5-glutamine methyltransferase [Legionella birminghamensis]STX30961.1 N5-glutamine methyltransferase [Legionella birminghamensis]